MEWIYLVIFLAAPLALLLILKEVRRKSRKNLTGRVVASVLSVVALVLIALPPTFRKTIDRTQESKVVLLTEGFSRDSLARYKAPLILSTHEQLLRKSGGRNKLLIPSIDYYLAENPEIKNLDILGTGLESAELNSLSGISVNFHGTPKLPGLQSINWPDKIMSGAELWVSGSYFNDSTKPVKISLTGLGSPLDSVIISPDSLKTFKLSCIPPQLGTSLNYLTATSGRDTIFREKLPFEVKIAEPLTILILSSSPDFELNFLKQWLAERGFSVAVRSRISNGKFSTESLNMEGRSLSLQSGTLQKADLLIADESAISQLTGSESGAVKSALNEGLGLIIRNEDDVTLRGPLGASFSTIPILSEKTLSLHIPGNRSKFLLPGNEANYIASQPYDQPLVWDQRNRIMVNSRISGLGRVVFSTLNHTYTWKLEGKTKEYSSFWSYLVEKAGRKKYPPQTIITDRFPVINKRTNILLDTKSQDIPAIFAGANRINMEQNVALPQRWQGAFWPAAAGWNLLKPPGNEDHSFYVYNEGDWKSLRQAENSRATERFAERSGYQKGNPSLKTSSAERIPVIFFYLLLLLCWGYLWIETKFL